MSMIGLECLFSFLSLLIDIQAGLSTAENLTDSDHEKNRRIPGEEIFSFRKMEEERSLIESKLLKGFENARVMEDQIEEDIREEFDGYSTVLVLGGFAFIFVMTCFLWTGMINFRAGRRERKLEKLRLKLVTKL